MIATMTGGLPVLELFARANAEHALPAHWEVWGNQATFNTADKKRPNADTILAEATAHGTPRRTSSTEGY